MELLDIFYNLKTPHNGGFKYNVIKRLKQNKPNIANFLKKDVLKNKIFVTANKYRNKYAHGTSPNEITDCNKLTEDTLVDIPIKDDQGKYIIDSNKKLTTKKVKATTFSYGVGEYTLVKDIMKNIDDFAIFTGNKIITLLDLMIEE
jgi:hypothetical protein